VNHHGLVVDPTTSRRLARIRQRDTSAEQLVRHQVHALGGRYRINNRDLPGSPDLANRAKGWAIFVHGCFWHAHLNCGRATVPKRNRKFWLDKFAANRARDRRVKATLRRLGFRVGVIWECEAEDAVRLSRVVSRFFTEAFTRP
jgi:DNA mismatch endonuclease (patch repair protein)